MDTLDQTTAPVAARGLDYQEAVDRLSGQILQYYRDNLPSNYVATVQGPGYMTVFQSCAIEIARIQLDLQGIYGDLDQPRAEFLYQLVGQLVFPGANQIPALSDDKVYREFLLALLPLVLKGGTEANIQAIVTLLVGAGTALVYSDGSLEMTIDVEGVTDWVGMERSIRLTVETLKPAQVLMRYRNLFRESLSQPLDTLTWDILRQDQDDARMFCGGSREITGTAGYFQGVWLNDGTRDFRGVEVGTTVVVQDTYLGVAREQTRTVREVKKVPVGDDSTSRAYQVLRAGSVAWTGTLTILGGYLVTTDWSALQPTDVVQILTGSNAGYYQGDYFRHAGRVKWTAPAGPLTELAVKTCWVRINQPVVVTSPVSYTCGVDWKGRQVVQVKIGEDLSDLFRL